MCSKTVYTVISSSSCEIYRPLTVYGFTEIQIKNYIMCGCCVCGVCFFFLCGFFLVAEGEHRSISMHGTHADFLSISVGRIISEAAQKKKKKRTATVGTLLNAFGRVSLSFIFPHTHVMARWLFFRYTLVHTILACSLVFFCFGFCVLLRCALRMLPLSRHSFRFAIFCFCAWSVVCSLHHKANPLYTDYVHNLYLHWYISILHNILYIRCWGQALRIHIG